MEFRDLKRQYELLKPQMDEAIQEVLHSSHYISGPQVNALEQALAEYVGVTHCITCANGTDALTLALKAWEVGPSDAVFVPDFTFFSSGECPAAEGATCIFVDVLPETFNINPEALEYAIRQVQQEGELIPKVVVAVDLFGQPAAYDQIRSICDRYGLFLLEDGAQGFGGSYYGQMACSFGDISTTSFFPAKPLGCYGDGGAIFTDNDDWAALIRSLTVHGKSGSDKYDNIYLGMNSRLDTMQAAILQVKLQAFCNYEIADVNKVAQWYNEALKDSGIILPTVAENVTSSWAQYTICLPDHIDRTVLQTKLKVQGIPTMVYYPKPMHTQGAFSGTRSSKTDCPETEKLCRQVLALPMGPYLTHDMVNEVANGINMWI